MSAARSKGTRWASAIVDYLKAQGWPHAELRNLSGAKVEWRRDSGMLMLAVPTESRGSPVTILEIRRRAP